MLLLTEMPREGVTGTWASVDGVLGKNGDGPPTGPARRVVPRSGTSAHRFLYHHQIPSEASSFTVESSAIT